MEQTQYDKLVENARMQRQQSDLKETFDSFSLEDLNESLKPIDRLVMALDSINKHITVDENIFNEAQRDYTKIAKELVTKLHWPNDAIRIAPQGSSGTQTLIRSPDNSKFDIDAICVVDLSKIDLDDPMNFFDTIGDGLSSWDPEPKKRCWTIAFSGRSYYLEFTPSVPLGMVPITESKNVIYGRSGRYGEKALAVVDTPTKRWKTSNPEGFIDWIAAQSLRQIVNWQIRDTLNVRHVSESVGAVPDQSVPLNDTLRIAIRLFKRHRDMSVRRNYIDSDVKPISIIIVTLLTQCYEGLADRGVTFNNPIELLIELAELMPHMYETRNGEYWIANPTVEGENFAEKWNSNPLLKKEFEKWTALILFDLRSILQIRNEGSLHTKLKEVFGCTGADKLPPSNGNGENSSGLAANPIKKTRNVPPTRGLA